MRTNKTLLISALLFMLLPMQTWGENSTQVPGYTIHHNALTTDFLSVDVANSYGIRRSKNRGLLNVSVIKNEPGTTGTAVTAKVSASARNLIGQTRELEMKEVKEAEAIYYLSDFPVVDHETLHFTIEVTPAGADRSHTAKLKQEFFPE